MKLDKKKQEQFRFLLNSGCSEAEIMDKLRLSSDEYSDEFTILKNEGSEFLDTTSSIAHISRLQSGVKLLYGTIVRAERLALQAEKLAKINPTNSQCLLVASKLNTELHNVMSSVYSVTIKAPLALSFDKFIQENIINGVNQKQRKRKISIFPEDIPDFDNSEAKFKSKRVLKDFEIKLQKGEITQEKFDTVKEFHDIMDNHYDEVQKRHDEKRKG